MKKRIIALVIIFFPFWTNSCGEPDYYEIVKINSQLQRIINEIKKGEEYQWYYERENINTLNDTVSIRYDSLGIEIIPDLKLIAQSTSNIQGLQSLYAWEKNIEYEDIIDIVIYSDRSYNENYPAGSDLKEIISFSIYNYISDWDLTELLANTSTFATVFMRFKEPPQEDLVRTISIRYITNKNNEFTSTTKKLRLLK